MAVVTIALFSIAGLFAGILGWAGGYWSPVWVVLIELSAGVVAALIVAALQVPDQIRRLRRPARDSAPQPPRTRISRI